MDTAPITVIVPCYRSVGTIQRAVESIARQTLVPTEVILVEDRSDDGTIDRLYQLRDQYEDGWIKILRSPIHGGPSVARNIGWNAASEPYIAFLDADDSWHPQKVELQYRWMSAHPDVALSGHRFGLKRDSSDPPVVVPASIVASSFSRGALLRSNRFSTPTVMLKRNIANRFDETKFRSEDFLLWLEICMSGNKHASLSGALTYLHKAPYGEGGLSSDLKAMTLGELDTYSKLFGKGYIGLHEYAVLRCWCWLKHMRRRELKNRGVRRDASDGQTEPAKEHEHKAQIECGHGPDARLPPLSDMPLVTVVTPSYNSGPYIADTLRSVQEQTYPRIEHIVLDSGSTDQTLEVLSHFPSVTVIKGAPAGMCDKVNMGFSLARGEVVAWVNADDYYLPGAIRDAVDALKQNQDIGLVYCNDLRVDDNGAEIRRIMCRQTGFHELVGDQNYVPNPTAFFRREALAAAGPVDVRFPLVSDWDLWIRISRRFPILYIDAWWAAFREHQGQQSDARRFTAWLQGRKMARTHGAKFLPLSWPYWRRMASQALFILRRRAFRTVNSGLRAIIGAAGR